MPGHMDHAKSIWSVSHIPAPDITTVVMWLYKKQNIWIFALYEMGSFCYVIDDTTQDDALEEDCRVANKGGYNSPKDAYEAAIEYTLKNLYDN